MGNKIEIWIKEWIKRNWEEKYVPFENDPHSQILIIGGITHKPWLRRTAENLQEFWMSHWKWIIGTAIAVAGLIGHLLKAK